MQENNLETVETTENASNQKVETVEKTYTQEELSKLIKSNVDRAVAKAHKEAKEKQEEIEKLEKMNYEQRAQYEQDKSAERIAELEAQLLRKNLEQDAVIMLQKEGIATDNNILDFVVREDAEKTVSAVNSFVELVNDLVKTKVTEALKGRTPNKVQNTNNMTKDEFNSLSYSQKANLFSQNPILYNELKGN